MKLTNKSFSLLTNQAGQILVEYLLLMVIAIGCATLLVNRLVGRGTGAQQGMLIRQWHNIIQIIGNDLPDCSKQTDFKSANCPP